MKKDEVNMAYGNFLGKMSVEKVLGQNRVLSV